MGSSHLGGMERVASNMVARNNRIALKNIARSLNNIGCSSSLQTLRHLAAGDSVIMLNAAYRLARATRGACSDMARVSYARRNAISAPINASPHGVMPRDISTSSRMILRASRAKRLNNGVRWRKYHNATW